MASGASWHTGPGEARVAGRRSASPCDASEPALACSDAMLLHWPAATRCYCTGLQRLESCLPIRHDGPCHSDAEFEKRAEMKAFPSPFIVLMWLGKSMPLHGNRL